MVLDVWVGPVVALLAVSVLAFTGFQLYARLVTGEAAASRLRRGLAFGLSLVAVLSVLALLVAGVVDAVAATFGAASPLAESVLTFLAAAVGVLVATTAGYAGALPAVLSVRDLEVTRGIALRRFVRWAGAIIGLVTTFVFATVHLTSGTGSALLPVTVAGGVLVYLAAPWLARVGTPTREPTGDERRRIDRILEDVAVEPRAVYVFEVANEMPSVSIRGLPGRRTLFLSDHLIDAYDDGAVRAVVAANANRAQRLYSEYRMTVGVGAVLAVYWAMTASPRPLLVLGGVAVVTTVLLWYGSRLVYAADAEAADRLGTDALAGTYRAIANDADLGGGRLQAFLRMRPRMDDRIGRLRESA